MYFYKKPLIKTLSSQTMKNYTCEENIRSDMGNPLHVFASFLLLYLEVTGIMSAHLKTLKCSGEEGSNYGHCYGATYLQGNSLMKGDGVRHSIVFENSKI